MVFIDKSNFLYLSLVFEIKQKTFKIFQSNQQSFPDNVLMQCGLIAFLASNFCIPFPHWTEDKLVKVSGLNQLDDNKKGYNNTPNRRTRFKVAVLAP